MGKKFGRSLIGLKSGRLVVVSGPIEKNNKEFWTCKCECGGVKTTTRRCIIGKNTKSCGCLVKEHVWNKKHGMFGTPTYDSWSAMRKRCLSPNSASYANYGGRGIKVCKRWADFRNFLKDMGIKPLGKSLGRINNDGNYTPSNCRWETAAQQQDNRRSVRRLTLNGVTKTATEWSKIVKIPRNTIITRLNKGYGDERSLTMKVVVPKKFKLGGISKTMSEWCKILGIKRVTVRRRLKVGYSTLDAFTMPLMQNRH